MVAIAALALGGMWFAWRARARRDAAVVASAEPLAGALIAEFPRASYVSTTPAGAPLERVAIPGLRYKGYASVAVRRDGVVIAVTGEAPVTIGVAQLTGAGTANGRVGKTVERDGLSLLRWRTGAPGAPARDVESSFRFADPAEQQRFATAISQVLTTGTNAQTNTTHPTIQEEA
nr:hypothetical protein [Leucobacter luti]